MTTPSNSKGEQQNPVVRLSGFCYNLVTSAVLEHGVVVWRALTRSFLQLYRFESPILGFLRFALSSFFYSVVRRCHNLVGSVWVLCNRVTAPATFVLLNDELYLGLFDFHVFKERRTRSIPIIRFGLFVFWCFGRNDVAVASYFGTNEKNLTPTTRWNWQFRGETLRRYSDGITISTPLL